jgi:signal transduction histidine kinase
MTLRPPPEPATTWPRGSLAVRMSLLVTAACLITSVIAGTLAVNLIRKSAVTSAQHTLSRLADATQATADQGLLPRQARSSQKRAQTTLQALKISSVSILRSNDSAVGDSALATASVTNADKTRLLAGANLSVRRKVDGHQVDIEGRATNAGAIVLVQRRADATAGAERSINRILIGLVIGALIAIALGLWVARRIALPLRRTADAAYALAQGRRDVAVPARGPTEVAEVGEAVNLLAAALSQSESRQREFLLSVSHDLRTPLTAIAGYAESLADGVVPAGDAAQVGAVLVTESKRLTRLVGDLMDLARLGSSEFRLDFAAVDLVELSEATARVWADRCAGSAIPFSLQAQPNPLWCWTDASRLRQILDGLLENALRVTPSGAPIVLAVRAKSATEVIAEVRDGGPGLTDDDLTVAFERSVLFERYRGIRQVGTGFGLAIVHGLVTRLGGTVEAGHSTEGGARFTVTLPAAVAIDPVT